MTRGLFQFIAAVLLVLAAPRGRADGAFQLLHTFPSSPNEPRLPGCRLLEVEPGVFYGTSLFGGPFNCGTVFRFRPDTGVEVIATFDGTNGFLPDGGLVQGPDGNLYGVTEAGGIGYSGDPPNLNPGPGTVFRVSLTGQMDTLFCFNATNSATPFGPLVFGADGTMYGVTFFGPNNGIKNDEGGTLFQISTNGALTQLHAFRAPDGARPLGLIEGTDGVFYGMSSGTAFRATTNGLVSVLARFSGTNGTGPVGLSRDPLGGFVGTTFDGGGAGLGTIFHLSEDGTFQTLYSFNGLDAARPDSGVVRGGDGALYGTTVGRLHYGYPEGSPDTNGSIFRLSLDGVLSIVTRFDGTNGLRPITGMMLASDGYLYGATADGMNESPFNGGTLYRVAQTPAMESVAVAGGKVTLAWRSFTHGSYQIQSKPTVEASDWMPVGPPVTTVDPLTQAIFPVPDSPQGIFRAVLIP
jgi:uncharacterized repeat protein (TIGR03803 family)